MLISAPKDIIKTLSRHVWMFLTKIDTPYYIWPKLLRIPFIVFTGTVLIKYWALMVINRLTLIPLQKKEITGKDHKIFSFKVMCISFCVIIPFSNLGY